jgi:hypothetical protein
VNIDDVFNAILDDEIDTTYDFHTVYILSDGQHLGSNKTAKLIKELLDQNAEIYGFSFGQEYYKCEIIRNGADYKNAMTGYYFQ